MKNKKNKTAGHIIDKETRIEEIKKELKNTLQNIDREGNKHIPRNVSSTVARIERELTRLEEQINDVDSHDPVFYDTIGRISTSQIDRYRNTVFRAFNAVCTNILLNTHEIERLNDIVVKLPNVTSGELAIKRMLMKIDSTDGASSISKREREVLIQLLGGKTNREISHELGISEKTVKNHLWKIYRKLDVENRTQLFNRLIST